MAFAKHVVQLAAATGGGNQDFTKSGAGTCAGAVFFVSRGITNATAADHATLSIGCTDGTNHAVANVRSEHGAAAASCDRIGTTDEVIQILNTGATTIDGEANFNAFITDGVRITWGNAPAGAYLIEAWLYFGDVECKAGVHTSGSSGGANDIADFGFTSNAEADILIAFSHGTSFNDTAAAANAIMFGMAANNVGIEQGTVTFAFRDTADPSETDGYATDTRILSNNSIAAISRALSITSFASGASSDQVEITHHSGSSSAALTFAYLAINLTGTLKKKVVFADSPTSTGNSTLGATSFTPQFAGICGSLATSLGSITGGHASVALGGVTSTDEFCASMSDEDAQATTDTQSITDSKALNLPLDSGAAGLIANFDSFSATGVVLNFTTVDGSARKLLLLLIEEEAAPAGGRIMSSLAGPGGLAGTGGIAGPGGGLAG